MNQLLLYCGIFLALADAHGYKKFVILIASYNNAPYVQQNICSALQNYPQDHYRIIYIDDCSTDNTYALAQKTITDHEIKNITLLHNKTRKGALYNQWHSIHNHIDDHEIVVILDGDDLLAGDFVLQYLNEKYTHHNIWLTYGQYREIHTQALGFNKPMPEPVVRHNNFRKWQDIPSHLRTFYAKLYKNIKFKDLTIKGKFFEMCADMATMIPMIEMARDHYMFIPDVLYLYNDTNPLSDYRKSRKLQMALDDHIRKLARYTPLENLFN